LPAQSVTYSVMTDTRPQNELSLVAQLAAGGYWAARAVRQLEQGKYSEVVTICREHLESEPYLISGRLAYASALYHAGQTESAVEQFRRVLALDPDNMVALKYLGDVSCAAGEVAAGLAYYRRVLELDPHCRGLKSPLKKRPTEAARTITLTRCAETHPPRKKAPLREIPFITETIGDLYLAQGYPELAAEVFRKLNLRGEAPRITEKLNRAEGIIKEKEH